MTVGTAYLTLLGGFEARLESGLPLTLPTHKYRALLAYLAVPPGHMHPRDKLVALLWPDHAREGGRAALPQALWVLRRALNTMAPDTLVLESDTVGLNAKSVRVDVTEFERVATGHDPVALGRADALYRGEFLAGLTAREAPFEEWLIVERERLSELALEALARLLAHERATGSHAAAVRTALRLLALDPLQEPIHRVLMQLYVQLGRREAALRQYQTCVGVLQRELDADPDEETRALYQQIVAHRAPAVTRPRADSGTTRPMPGGLGRAVGDEGPFIGRALETTLLGQALEEALAGRGQVVAILGEAGIGKSRLVARLAGETARRGARVIAGRSYEGEQVLPFGPWVDALRQGEVTADEDVLAALHPGYRAALGRLVPELGTAVPMDVRTDTLQLFEAVTLLVNTLADRHPLMLALEDLHWADEMSIRLFSYLARRVQGRLAVLVVVTMRVEEDAPLLQRVLDDLERELPLLQLSLTPLPKEDTNRLVSALTGTGGATAVGADLSEAVWNASQGNPFMVIEMLQALRDGGVLDPASLPLPERVRSVVTRRFARLGPAARQLVATAAVIGRDFSFALLQRASGLTEDDAVAAVEELVRRRIFAGSGERFDFSHDRIREVAAAELLPPRRRLLHRRIAEALEALHAGDLASHESALGNHYLEAEVWDRAAEYLRRAGMRAREQGANREGVVILERALGAVARAEPGAATTALTADIRLNLVRVSHSQGKQAEIAEHLRCARSLIADLGDRRREALERMYTCEYLRNARDPAGALDAGQAGLGIAGELSDPALVEEAHFHLGCLHLVRGDYPRALEHLEKATEGAEARPARVTFPYFPGLARRARCLAELGRFEEARRFAQLGVEVAVAGGHPSVEAPSGLGLVLLMQGEAAQAIAPLELTLERSRVQQFAILLGTTIAALVHAYALVGRRADAIRLLDEFLEGRVVVPDHLRVSRIFTSLGHAALLVARPEDARCLAGTALDVAIASGEEGSEAKARAVLGKILAGDAAADPTRGTWTEAEQQLRRALGLAERLGMRPLVAHCHCDLGRLQRHGGDHAQAETHLATAAAMYGDMGMRAWPEELKGEPRIVDSGTPDGSLGLS